MPIKKTVGDELYLLSVPPMSTFFASPAPCTDHILGGSGDLVSGLIMGITSVTIWVIGVIDLLTKSP